MSNTNIESGFQFEKYIIKKTYFEINDEFTGGEVGLDLNLSTNFTINNEENDFALVILECEIFKDHIQNNYPFNLVVEIVGKFNLIGIHNTEELITLCKVNATAILFPYLRAYISHLTSLSGLSAITLPTVNVQKFLEIETNE